MFSRFRICCIVLYVCVKLLKICLDLMRGRERERKKRRTKDIFCRYSRCVMLTERHPVVKAFVHIEMIGIHYYV